MKKYKAKKRKKFNPIPCSGKAQVWVETVIYTLIAFVMLGAVLAFVKPKIEEIQDKAIIEQTLGVIKDINTLILSVIQGGPGNKRIIEMEIKKGQLEIDGKNDRIVFKIESRYAYSEPGEDVPLGSVTAHTKKRGKFNIISLTSNYSGEYNITYKGGDNIKTITKSSTPYKLSISNNGRVGNYTLINIEVE